MSRVKKCFISVLTLMFVLVYVPKSHADEASELILKLLIKKGLITQKEVNELKSEIQKVKPPTPRGLEERVTRLEGKQFELPSWVRSLKFKGDLRLRQQYVEDDLGQDNSLQRLRFRLGATAKLNDKVNVGFGFATGSSDGPTSTNQTLENEFDSKNIWLDYAYAEYDPYEWLHLIGGKFKTPFFHTDMLWDSDIRFDGFAIKASHKINPDGKIPTSVHVTTGYFPIDDANTSDGDDIYLLALQAGVESKFADGYAKLKIGLAYYDFQNSKGALARSFAEEKGTNTYVGAWSPSNTSTNTSYLKNDYRILTPTAMLSFKDFFGVIDISWGVLGEYAHNLGAPSNEEAWRIGAWLGKNKVKKKKDWKFLAQYSVLEQDATLDAFPDSDFNNGGTGGEGLELIFDYGITDKIFFSIDYYLTERIGIENQSEQVVQADMIFKF